VKCQPHLKAIAAHYMTPIIIFACAAPLKIATFTQIYSALGPASPLVLFLSAR